MLGHGPFARIAFDPIDSAKHAGDIPINDRRSAAEGDRRHRAGCIPSDPWQIQKSHRRTRQFSAVRAHYGSGRFAQIPRSRVIT
jgi:hypothetical protein